VTRVNKAVLVLLALVVVPVVFFSGYQIAALSDSEAMMSRIYRQQLDLILMSVNQAAWDVVNGWVNRISAVTADYDQPVSRVLDRTPAIREIFFGDSDLRTWATTSRYAERSPIQDTLRKRADIVERLFRYDSLDYRKIEQISWGSGPDHRTALVFVTGGPKRRIAGLVLDDRRFVTEVLAPRIADAAGNEFVLGVIREGEVLYTTGDLAGEALAQSKALWVFPHLSVGIRMRGASLDQTLRERLWWNIGLIVGLDLLLIGGIWLVYRWMRREIELLRLRSDFISTVSHELRTPLALIRMYAETLEMGRMEDPARRKEYLGTILSETERLTRLVNDVLTVSRADARTRRLEQVDVNEVVREVVHAYEGRLTSGGFRPILALAEPVAPILADREGVAEALINLLDNAMKYSASEKYLRIATGEEGRRVFVEVEDHGKGIATEHQKKVFEAFYRVTEGMVHSTRGTGLGLALVKRIMEAHGGEVLLSSVPGKGSTFRLLFRKHQG
jgi:two-component system, OmpR family, phosphate regulon sensor histidine kinase PhoR